MVELRKGVTPVLDCNPYICAIFDDYRWSGMSSVRGVNLPSPIHLRKVRYRPSICVTGWCNCLYDNATVHRRNVYCVECPADFTYIPSVNGCYKVVTRNLDWSAAGLACRSLHKDAHLLVINDAAEQNAVAAMLSSIDGQCALGQG